MPFQQTVNVNPAPGIEGSFASANPWYSLLAGPSALVSGANLVIGRFAWVDPTRAVANSSGGQGTPDGFVGRDSNMPLAMITTYLAEYGSLITPGHEVTLYTGGDFWVVNRGATVAVPRLKVYASYADGSISFAPTGSAPIGASVTGSIAPASTVSFTGSIAANTLTVTAVASGTIVAGGLLAGTGIPAGVTVVSQQSGTTGGVGVYTVSVPLTVASETMTESYGVLTVTAVGSGALVAGDVISGTGVTAGSYLIGTVPAGGQAGTYYVSATQTATSTTITANSAVETKWIAGSIGQPGELVKISAQVIG